MWMRWATSLIILAVAMSAHADENTPPAEVIDTFYDFRKATPGPAQPLVIQWSWSDEQKQQAASFSTRQVVEVESGRALQLTVTSQMPWGPPPGYRAMTIGPDLLPPTADAIRLHYRVLEGEVTIAVGGPTIYFGHSDVQSRAVTLTADGTDQWRTVEFPLHSPVTRNFRRAGFARHSPVIYYTRWIQEPLGIYLFRDSVGSFLISHVELLHTGQGRPYPTFNADETKVIATINEFDSPDTIDKAFRAIHAKVDFSGPPQLVRKDWTPPKLSHVPAADDRQGMLRIDHSGFEEVIFTGIKVDGVAGANAIAIDLRATHPMKTFDELSIDFNAFTAPPSNPFEWARFAPPPAWLEQPELSFDYYLDESAVRDVPHTMHHARRAVANGEWTRIIIPLADFVCVYGGGEMADALQKQQPIDSAQVFAIGMLSSWRQRSGVTTYEIDRIQWVHVPGDDAALRSFPQVGVDQVQLVPMPDLGGGGGVEMTLKE